MTKSLQKWTEIEQFRHVVKYVKHTATTELLPTLMFRGTIKLHGTNIGVTREGGEYYPQSRNQYITAEQDAYGFAAWFLESLKDPVFRSGVDTMFDSLQTDEDDVITIYGEYVGPGIQSRVAVSKMEHKSWFIFGARVNGVLVSNTTTLTVPSCDHIYNILDFPIFFQGIDFNEDLGSVLEHLQRLTLSVEESCPVGEKLGVPGIGEGIVWTCLEYPENTKLIFKTKGEKHSGKARTERRVASVAPEVLEKLKDVVNYVVTDGRLHQGLEHIPCVDLEHLGSYLQWISRDIIKEESDTIEASGLSVKDVNKAAVAKAKTFFMGKLNSNL